MCSKEYDMPKITIVKLFLFIFHSTRHLNLREPHMQSNLSSTAPNHGSELPNDLVSWPIRYYMDKTKSQNT